MALFLHGFEAHTSISIEQSEPWKPATQLHANEPRELKQVALFLQGCDKLKNKTNLFN